MGMAAVASASSLSAPIFFRPQAGCDRPPSRNNFLTPISARNRNPSRLGISHTTRTSPVSPIADGNLDPKLESSSSSSPPSARGGTIDLKFPRRSLSVEFTCNACGERTTKLINRLAYERGTVFVQCTGCWEHHKLVDNLGLVVEYDLQEDDTTGSNANLV